MLLGRGVVNYEVVVHARPDAVLGTHEDVILDFDVTPHALVLGSAGSGKTSLGRSILTQWLDSQGDAVVVDVPYGEYAVFKDTPGLSVVSGVADAARMLASVRDEIEVRYTRLTAAMVDRCQDLPGEQLRPLLVIVDNPEVLLPVKISRDNDRRVISRNLSVAEVYESLSVLARLGRAVGVHVIVATQRWDRDRVLRPDVDLGEGWEARIIRARESLMLNLEARVLLGRTDHAEIRMAGFPVSRVAATPGIPGRGLYGRVGGAPQEIQIAFASLAQIEEHLRRREAGGLTPTRRMDYGSGALSAS